MFSLLASDQLFAQDETRTRAGSSGRSRDAGSTSYAPSTTPSTAPWRTPGRESGDEGPSRRRPGDDRENPYRRGSSVVEASAPESSRVRDSLDQALSQWGGEIKEPKVLWVVVADYHNDTGAFRRFIEQAVEYHSVVQELAGEPVKLKFLDIGDSSDGHDLDELRRHVDLPSEFGIAWEDYHRTGGNSEYRGYQEPTLADQARWQRQSLRIIDEGSTLLRRVDPVAREPILDRNGNPVPVADDQVSLLDLGTERTEEVLAGRDGRTHEVRVPNQIAYAHKPNQFLQHERSGEPLRPGIGKYFNPLRWFSAANFLGETVEETSAVGPWWSGVNLRNLIGMPIVFATGTLPSWAINLATVGLINLAPYRLNAKVIVPDAWRLVWSNVQNLWDITRGKSREEGYRPRPWRQRSGPYLLPDAERSFGERLRDRTVGALPRYDPETFHTMRRNTAIHSSVKVVLHGHTHRSHESVIAVPNEFGEMQLRVVVGVSPPNLDPNVARPFAGWNSLLEVETGDGSRETLVMTHSALEGGEIVSSISDNIAINPQVRAYYEKHGIPFHPEDGAVQRYSPDGASPTVSCKRLLSDVAHDTKGRHTEKWRDLGKKMGVSTRAQ